MFNDKTYIQQSGLAMGAPTSSIFSEIFIQFLENTKIYDILNQSKIIGYFRYVDDILLIYDDMMTDIDVTLDKFNNIIDGLKFTIEREHNNSINFLDITVSKETNKFNINIFRKPTTTDTIIPNDSNHPIEQKMAAIRYYANRIQTYSLGPVAKTQETNTIKQILQNNKYNPEILTTLTSNITHLSKHHQERKLQKWAKFTYIGKETRIITKLFKNTQVRTALSTTNKLGKLLNTRTRAPMKSKFDNTGVYQLTCPTCQKKYTGQTGRSFQIRYKEHFRDFKYNHSKSKFACHVINEDHSFGKMEDIMEPKYITNKGNMLDTMEKFYIYQETYYDNQINDKLTTLTNPIFDTLIRPHIGEGDGKQPNQFSIL
jgi:hypothetical protein